MKQALKIMRFIRDRLGLFILIVLLSIITVASIKPGFFLIGWDNYSSYFEPGINMFRTFFATWRDYRGLGVPSDAEVTDMFRQLLFVPLGLLLPRELLDQAYYLIALWLGVLAMYVLAGMIVNDLPIRGKDIFGCIASMFYLFNLNTLSVFYSPLIPFTNRFYSLPLTLAMLLWFVRSKQAWWRFFLLAAVIIATSGSYITPTVVITSFLAFGLFSLSNFSIRQTILYTVVFLGLNAFWILPFVNYTREKCPIVPLARTFVEINESTLNRPAHDFSWDKQVILRPSFFDLNFHSLTGQSFPVHPLLGDYTTSPWHYLLFLFPILYLAGSILIIVKCRKTRRAIWIPAWIIVFIFLSMKEFSSLGFFYIWLKDHIPLFEVIFRISDTKFHAYVNLAGSIAAAYMVMVVYYLFHKKRAQVFFGAVVFIVGLGYIWPFRTYFTGDLIGSLAYTKIPNAYFDVARVINKTPGEGRVLHLPMDSWHSYWRSFSWGYVGSAFFQYLINKPYIDKTFEPASLENSYLHGRVASLIDSFYRSNDTVQKKRLAGEFAQLLRQTGIQYVILDESISSSVYARNMTHEAKQWYAQAKELVEYTVLQGDVIRKKDYTLSLGQYYKAYEQMYPITRIGIARSAPAGARIDLYEVKGVQPAIRFVQSGQNVDTGIANLLETGLNARDGIITQEPWMPSQLLPFLNERHRVERSTDGFTIRYDNPNASDRSYRIKAGEASVDSYMIDVSGNVVDSKLRLTFSHRYYPDINGKRLASSIGAVSLPFHKTNDLSQYRLKLNDVIIPLPAAMFMQETSLGSFMLHEKTIRVSLLSKRSEEAIPLSLFTPTDPPSCFGTPPKTYEGDVRMTDGEALTLSARYGSACARTALSLPPGKDRKPLYAELELALQGAEESATHAYVCLKEGSSDECLDGHRNIRVLANASQFRIPLRSMISNAAGYTLDLGVVAPDGVKKELNVVSAQTVLFEPGKEYDLLFIPAHPAEQVTISGPLNISFPRAISAYSYFHNPDTELFYVPLEPCRGEKPSDRTIRMLEDILVTHMVNCSTHFAQWLRYAPDRPYLFTYEYWLGSGQQPSIVLGRKGDNYFFERASLYQGYPNISGMKKLRGGVALVSASRFIEPRFFTDSAPADTAIHLFQDTANAGVFAVRGFDMIEYPAAWQRMSITPDDSSVSYPVTQAPYSFRQILPSLWKVEGDVPEGGLLFFNRGYDRQWGIYDSVLGLLFGRSLSSSIRCDGFANCFRMPSGRTFYLFYMPERLALAGWMVTLLAIVFSCIRLCRRKAASS